MDLIMVKNDEELADCAAKLTIETLKAAINEFGEASWVLSGGNTPRLSYQIIASRYRDYLDWQKVWFLIGDERHVKFDNPDSNWGAVETSLLSELTFDPDHKLAPMYHENLNIMAKDYADGLIKLPKAETGLPRLDLVWLGIGEDGHTLSLFPGRKVDSNSLVSAVYDSSKLPKERITLNLSALKNTKNCIILAAGADKADAIAGLVEGDLSLPISQAIKAVEDNGGKACLVADTAAGSRLM